MACPLGGRSYLQTIIRAVRAAAARYRSVPASVLYPQLFLGFGWIRASVANGTTASWWSGDELLTFLESTEALRLPIYAPFIDLVVRPLPIFVSVIVVVLQVLVGLALLANVRPVAWTLVGIFLNVNFIMAGSVNPSVFYVVMGMAVVLWIMLDRMTAERANRMAVGATIVAAVTLVVCGPFITTFDPARVIEDPSLVLICLSMLFAVSCRLTYGELAGDGDLEVVGLTTGQHVRAGGLIPPERTTLSRVLPGRGPRRSFDTRGSTSLETDLQELRATSPAEIMDAMDRPIPRLPSRGTMTYHEDVDSGFSIKDDLGASGATGSTSTGDKPRVIANFEVNDDPPLQWYSVRCHFRVDDRHYEERITVWEAVGFDDAIDLAEAEAESYPDGDYLGSCDCFHLSDAGMRASQGSEIYSLVRASDLDPDTYLRTFFFTGSERSAEV